MLVIPINIKIRLHEYEEMYTHYIIPFSGEEILNSEYFYEYKKDFSDVISRRIERNIELPKIMESVNTDDIIEDLPFILLDSLFSLQLCFGNQALWKHLRSSRINSIIESKKDIIQYVGIFTEFLKVHFLNLKYDISILINIFSNKNVNQENACKLIALILQKYNNAPVINSINNQTITAGINCILHSYSFNNSFREFDIDLFAFEEFIKLLNANRYYKYLFDRKCFCLTNENNSYFFSLSGMDKKSIESFYQKISKELKRIVKVTCGLEYEFIPSMLSDETLSYGNFLNNKFQRFQNLKSIKYKDSDKSQSDIGRQYSCCERKIFANLKNGTGDLAFYCKYAPCDACQPALNENAYYYKITFEAFISTPEAFMKNVERYKNKILSIKNYNLITYM